MKMIKLLMYSIIGMLFGITMSQSGFLSWMAWQDMFMLREFRLFGVIMITNLTGMTGIWLIKKFKIRNADGVPIEFTPKTKSFYRYALGGLIFGTGWTIAGCPGTTYTLIGHGNFNMIFVISGALTGTILYALLKKYLPH